MSDSIARLLDHSLLHPTLTDDELRAGCELARRLEVASVCIKPYAVPLAAEILAGSPVHVGTVIGFPHGAHCTETKMHEAELACRQGATELDMVINVGRALSGDWTFVAADIQAVVDVAHLSGAIVKVIFETDFVTRDEDKIRLCQICEHAGAEFVKTSTGFGFVRQQDGGYAYRGATEHDVRLLRAHAGHSMQVKAAGGIRTYEDAVKIRDCGASRIGATASEAIVAGERAAQATAAAR
ncbi:MAG: deoxyribose-phosphate aldolase [Pirellulales bacterium]